MKQPVDHFVDTPGAEGRFAMRVDQPATLELAGQGLKTAGADGVSAFKVVDARELIAP